MDDKQWFADQFAQHRPRLRAVAYRMLGSVTEADDALQEAWIRSVGSGSSGIANVEAWLSTVVGRVCIDILRRRGARPEDPAGDRLPEPIVTTSGRHHPEEEAILADSVGLALLVVLDSLSPAERLAFVLHDMFAVPFDEIAPVVERTPEATRQLASRARRRVRGSRTAPDADLATQQGVVAAFLAAAREGDFQGLLAVLDPEIVFRADAGERRRNAPALLTGSVTVAERAAAVGPRFAKLCHPALVNGAAGLVARKDSRLIAVIGVTVTGERITEIDLILNESRLAGLSVTE